MWRAYGGNSGVAIIFKQDFFSEIYTDHGLDFSCVAYLNQYELKIRNQSTHNITCK